jgi:hypothetical protein
MARPTTQPRLLVTYRTPRFRYGQTVRCEINGPVVIVGLSAAPIPWPVCKGGKLLVPVVYQGLAKAVCREADQAVAHCWGVGLWSVWQWRKALGVCAVTEGTVRLKHDHALAPGITAGRAKAHAMSRDPETGAARREKIAAAKRGKPRPAQVIEAMRKGCTGKPHDEEARRTMSEAQRRRGARPPKAGRSWTEAEDALVVRLPASQAAERTGRTLRAVYDRRRELQLPDGRRRL